MTHLKPVLIVSTLLTLLSCGRDRNVDDYQDDQIRQEAAKIETIRGAWRGSLSSKSTGEILGPLNMEIQTARRIEDRKQDSKPVAHLAVPGTVDFLHLTKVAFLDSYYDAKSGSFKATITFAYPGGQVLRVSTPSGSSSPGTGTTGGSTPAGGGSGASGTTVSIDIGGTFSGNTFEGVVEAQGYPDRGMTFTLTKDAQEQSSGGLNPEIPRGRDGEPVLSLSSYFEGQVKYQQGDYKLVKLRIDKPNTPNERFINKLVPYTFVNMAIDFGTTAQYGFPNSQWDEQIGSITGSTSLSNISGGVTLGLDCREYQFRPSEPRGLICEWKSTRPYQIVNPIRLHPVTNRRG